MAAFPGGCFLGIGMCAEQTHKNQEVAEVLGLEGSVPATLVAGRHRDPADKAAGTELDFLRDFCDGDEVQMRHFIQRFLEQYPAEINQLEAAWQSKDREALYLAAHSFRPQLEFLGLQNAAGLAQILEQGARSGMPFEELLEPLTAFKAGEILNLADLRAFADLP